MARPSSGQLEARARIILDLIEACGQADLPCPSDVEIAKRLGVGSAAAGHALKWLRDRKMIDSRAYYDGGKRRVVTVMATGTTTAAAVRRTPAARAPVVPPSAPDHGGCRYIAGDTAVEWRYCGGPTVEAPGAAGRTWCARHLAVVYRAP